MFLKLVCRRPCYRRARRGSDVTMRLRPASILYDRTVLKVGGVAVVTSPATYSRVVDLTVDPFGVIAKEPHARGVVVDHQGGSRSPQGCASRFQMPV